METVVSIFNSSARYLLNDVGKRIFHICAAVRETIVVENFSDRVHKFVDR